MSRTLNQPAPQPKAPVKPPAPPAEKPKESWRDLIEQFVIAIILAILVRGFDAEAFVIPTGSMAPTLMGRHKEIACPQCSYTYAINASEDGDAPGHGAKEDVGICPNCRFSTLVGDAPNFKGDRILVMKFPYELPNLPGSSAPKRWDVVVFHYPVSPETNYIKRMVGLPGEDLRIHRGDLQTRPSGTTDPFQIQRKPLYHQRAMQMLVHDDSHVASKLRNDPAWDRWRAGSGWKKADRAVSRYEAESTPGSADWARLPYEHRVPDLEQWAALDQGDPLPHAPRASLVTDFYGYNTSVGSSPVDGWLQSNWVGDLTVNADVEVRKAAGLLRFELVEGGIANRCDVDLATGKATLFHGDVKLGEADTTLTGTGTRRVSFANVDDRLTLWVDGATPFGDGLAYANAPDQPQAPTAADLQPASIAVRDGASVAVAGLVVERDIYYTQDPSNPDYRIAGAQVSPYADTDPARVTAMVDFLADPARFSVLGDQAPGDPFVIRPDHFMMMGDNSPRSWDSRKWSGEDRAWRTEDRSNWEVPRGMLIGKAFFVYWPHGKPFGPDIRVTKDLRIPFRPYIERMKLIH